MKTKITRFFWLAPLVLCAALIGCTKMYTITTPLEQPVPANNEAYVGEIADNLPDDVKKRPTLEEIDKFRAEIANQLHQQEVFVYTSGDAGYGDATKYLVRGSLSDYKKGSGAVRFLIGFGAGNAKVKTHLELLDKTTGVVVFAGDFEGKVTDWAESGFEMFKRVAKDFAKQLAKQSKNLMKNQPKG